MTALEQLRRLGPPQRPYQFEAYEDDPFWEPLLAVAEAAVKDGVCRICTATIKRYDHVVDCPVAALEAAVEATRRESGA